MTVNRLQIRQAMLSENVSMGLYGTATAGSTTTLTDTTNLAVGGNSTSRFMSYFLYRPAAATASDKFRRVTPTGYAPTTGVLTQGTPAWTIAPLASSDSGYYELWQYDPVQVNAAISRALTKRCFALERDLVTPNGQSRYDITASPFSLPVTNVQDQILEIVQFYGTDPNARIQPWQAAGKTWWPETDGATLYVRFDTPPTGTIQVTWKKPYTALTDDSTTSTVPLEYVAWASFFELFDALSKQAIARGESDAPWASLRQSAFDRYWTENHKYLDRFASQFFVSPAKGRTRGRGPVMGRTGSQLYGPGGARITGT